MSHVDARDFKRSRLKYSPLPVQLENKNKNYFLETPVKLLGFTCLWTHGLLNELLLLVNSHCQGVMIFIIHQVHNGKYRWHAQIRIMQKEHIYVRTICKDVVWVRELNQ